MPKQQNKCIRILSTEKLTFVAAFDAGDRRSPVSTTAATVGRRCRRQRRRSVAVVDDSGDGRSPLSTTAATETAILLEEYSGSLRPRYISKEIKGKFHEWTVDILEWLPEN
ncbi:hypothetical protein Y032_0266g692 [Ancylostoma ceylanicum]|uniref:Uncharacterized protein n=1 Tax=Ancylostoma ceylanicum TaxID=53326 RepID=A0A016S9A7_9BILA|nr:hypothetical protein Y032_0266g692 [Ancylostoma ceylanicum]